MGSVKEVTQVDPIKTDVKQSKLLCDKVLQPLEIQLVVEDPGNYPDTTHSGPWL